MNSNKNTRSRRRHGDRAPGSRRQSRSPKRTKKRKKRGGKRTSGRGGIRRNMTNSERLSRKYFKIYSLNCASDSRRGAVLERLACGFDVLCLQKTRTRPENPLELKYFLVVQKHDGRGMARAFRKDLQNTVSTVVQQLSGTSRYSSTKA